MTTAPRPIHAFSMHHCTTIFLMLMPVSPPFIRKRTKACLMRLVRAFPNSPEELPHRPGEGRNPLVRRMRSKVQPWIAPDPLWTGKPGCHGLQYASAPNARPTRVNRVSGIPLSPTHSSALLDRTVHRGAHALPRLAAELEPIQVDQGVLGDLHVGPAQCVGHGDPCGVTENRHGTRPAWSR